MTASEIQNLVRFKQQTLTDAATIAFDVSLGRLGVLNTIASNRNISFSNLASPDAVILKVTHSTAGTSITLPGRLAWDFQWATSKNETTICEGTWDGTEWIWRSTIFDAVDTGPVVTSAGTTDTTHIALTFDRVVTATGVGFSFRKNGSNLASSAMSGSGTNTLTFTVATMASGDALDYSYTQSTGDCIDAAAVQLANTTNATVTNNITGDSDAQNWINAVIGAGGSIDSTHQGYMTTLVTGLKADSLWTGIKGLWIPIFGSIATCKWNIKNSADTDAGFRLSFSSGWTFASNGVTPDGATASADTHINTNTQTGLNTLGMGAYLRSNGSGSHVYVMGDYNGTQFNTLKANSSTWGGAINSNGGEVVPGTTATRLVFEMRISSTNLKFYRDGTLVSNSSVSSTSAPNLTIYVGALNNSGSAGFFSDQPVSAWVVTDSSFSDSDIANLTTRINNFMTSWGINV